MSHRVPLRRPFIFAILVLVALHAYLLFRLSSQMALVVAFGLIAAVLALKLALYFMGRATRIG